MGGWNNRKCWEMQGGQSNSIRRVHEYLCTSEQSGEGYA